MSFRPPRAPRAIAMTETDRPASGRTGAGACVALASLAVSLCASTAPALALTEPLAEIRDGTMELALETGTLSIGGSFAVQRRDGNIAIMTSTCLDIRSSEIVAGADARLAPLDFTLCPQGSGPVLLFTGGKLHIDGRIPPTSARLGGAEALLDGTLPAVSFTGALDLEGESPRLAGTWTLEGGRMTLAAIPARLDNADLNGTLAWQGTTGVEAALTGGSGIDIHDLSHVKRWRAVRTAGTARYTGSAVTFDMGLASAVTSAADRALGRMKGAHSLKTGRGAASMSGAPTFAQGALQPGDLSDLVPRTLKNVNGTVTYTADIAWGDTFDGKATAETDGLGFVFADNLVRDVAGTLTLAGLNPLRTEGQQHLTIGAIESVFALSDGTVTYTLPGDDSLVVREAKMDVAGGDLTLAAERIGFNDRRQEFAVTAHEIDLERLLDEIAVPGLSGTGKLNGTLPLAMQDGNLVVRQGDIAAAAPGGVIRYVGAGSDAAAAGGEAAILADALENFHYTDLSAHLSGDADDNLLLRLQLKGANPDLYDGYPFEINISTRGDLMTLVRNSAMGFQPLELLKGDADALRPAPE